MSGITLYRSALFRMDGVNVDILESLLYCLNCSINASLKQQSSQNLLPVWSNNELSLHLTHTRSSASLTFFIFRLR